MSAFESNDTDEYRHKHFSHKDIGPTVLTKQIRKGGSIKIRPYKSLLNSQHVKDP